MLQRSSAQSRTIPFKTQGPASRAKHVQIAEGKLADSQPAPSQNMPLGPILHLLKNGPKKTTLT